MTFINQQTNEVQLFIQNIVHSAIEVGRECEKLQFDRLRTADIVATVLDVNDRMFNQVINGDVTPVIKSAIKKVKELAGNMVGDIIEDEDIVYVSIKTTSEQKIQVIDLLHDAYEEVDKNEGFINIIGNVLAGFIPLEWRKINGINLKDEFTHIIPNYLIALEKYQTQ